MIATPPGPIPIEALLKRSWALLRSNWIVIVPPIVALAIGVTAVAVAWVPLLMTGALAEAAAHGSYRLAEHPFLQTYGTLLAGVSIALGAVTALAAVWALTAVFGIADAAWERGHATFADGNAAFRTRWGAILAALVGYVGLGIVALILALPTLGLALLAFPLLTMYAIPAVVSGRRGGFAAIGESFRLVRRRFGLSAIALLVIAAMHSLISLAVYPVLIPLQSAFAGGHPTAVAGSAALIAGGLVVLAAMFVSYAYYGFVALVLVGLYRSLTHSGAVPGGVEIVPA